MSGKRKNARPKTEATALRPDGAFVDQPPVDTGLVFKPFPPIERRACRCCGAQIAFGYTPDGAPIAYDPEPLEVVWPCRNSITIKRDVYREHACSRAHRLAAKDSIA